MSFLRRIPLVLLPILLLLAACTVPPAPTAAPPAAEPETAPTAAPAAAQAITVILPKHEADLVGFWPARIQDFEKDTGIKVTLINMSWDKVADKVLTEMAAGGHAYDVIEFDNGWVAKFLQAGWLEPLDAYIPANATEGMVPGLVDMFSRDGKTYGLVWNNDIRFFLYNAEMLEQAGIAAPPKTWDELVAQCKTLQEKGIVKYCLSQPWEQSWTVSNEFHFFTYTFGGEMLGADNKFKWNQSPAPEAMQFMVDLIQKEKVVNPASLTFSQEAQGNVFLAGETAFFLQGWPGLYASAQDPNLSKVVGKIKIGLVPGKVEGQSAALALPEAMAIPKSSKNKEAAGKFIAYMASKDVNKKMAAELGAIPIFSELYTDPALLEKYPFWADFAAQLASARGLMQVTWLDQWAQVAIIEVQKALGAQQTVQQALDAIYAQTKDFEGQP